MSLIIEIAGRNIVVNFDNEWNTVMRLPHLDVKVDPNSVSATFMPDGVKEEISSSPFTVIGNCDLTISFERLPGGILRIAFHGACTAFFDNYWSRRGSDLGSSIVADKYLIVEIRFSAIKSLACTFPEITSVGLDDGDEKILRDVEILRLLNVGSIGLRDTAAYRNPRDVLLIPSRKTMFRVSPRRIESRVSVACAIVDGMVVCSPIMITCCPKR